MESGTAPDTQNHFGILGLDENASPESIHQAFEWHLRRWNPKRCTESAPEEAKRRLVLVTEAYKVLSDPNLKRAYQNELKHQESTQHLDLAVPERIRPITDPSIKHRRLLSEGEPLNGAPTGNDAVIKDSASSVHQSKCVNCGRPAGEPIPPELQAIRVKMQRGDPDGHWCIGCLRNAPILSCSGCGTGGHCQVDLRACKHCGKSDICAECMRTIDGGKENPCAVCARILIVRGIRVFISQVSSIIGSVLVFGWFASMVFLDLYLEITFVASAIRDHEGIATVLGGAVLLAFPLFGVGYVLTAILGLTAFTLLPLAEAAEKVAEVLFGWTERRVRAIGYPRPSNNRA